MRHSRCMKSDLVSFERLHALYDYDPATGAWTRKIARKGRNGAVGFTEGALSTKGYAVICADNHRYFSHRLAWFWMTGQWPDRQIDHIDGDKLNNRWANLRLATPSQNLANTGKPRHNTSGFKGVSWSKNKNKWRAYISIENKTKHLGYFEELESAHVAYDLAANAIHGEFARSI